MFKFISDDNENGKDRKRRLLIEMINYASTIHNSLTKIGEYCGYSKSGICKIVNNYDELKHLRIQKDSRYLKVYNHYKRKDLWKRKHLE